MQQKKTKSPNSKANLMDIKGLIQININQNKTIPRPTPPPPQNTKDTINSTPYRTHTFVSYKIWYILFHSIYPIGFASTLITKIKGMTTTP